MSRFVQYLVEDVLSKLLSIIHTHTHTQNKRRWSEKEEKKV